MSYRIIRHYFKRGKRIIKRGLTLEEAQRHCKDPETSSRTCTLAKNVRRTRMYGDWFDGYEEAH
jgi:hypothetical protein